MTVARGEPAAAHAGQRRDQRAPLRILYSFPDTLGAPGIGTTAWNHVRGLVGIGHDVRVFATAVARDAPGATEVVTTLSVAGRRIPHRALGRRRAYDYHDWRVARALARPRHEVDVVHCWPRATIRTAPAARAIGAVSVREAPNTHTAYAYERVAEETRRLGLDLVSGHSHSADPRALDLEEREYASVDSVAVPSEFVRRTFLERGLPAERLGLHQYGFEPERFPPPEVRDRDGAGGLHAIFVGRCEPRKGLHLALDAWIASGAAERGTFTICGSFYPGYEAVLAEQLAHPSVVVEGFVADVGELMRGSDVLVLPTVEEGSALVTYEAQASGCVLVVSDAAGARCEHMREGLVHEAGDVAALTEHLRLLDRDAELLARLRSATLARRDSLTWEQCARDLERLYRDLLAR
jgi:glycosyltransferase involved in cell wall biosynthesis